MNKKNTVWISLLVCFYMMVGCDNDPCLHGTGREIVLPVTTGVFNNVEVKGIFEVMLREDTIDYVEFRGGEEVLKYVRAEVKDSVLRLFNQNTCFFLRDYEKIIAILHYRKIDQVILKVASKVVSDGPLTHIKTIQVHGEMGEVDVELAADYFVFYNHRTAGGNFLLKGYAEHCTVMNYYTARCDISGLSARRFYVTNGSLSDLYVNAGEYLQVRLLNKGNIYYSGTPEIVIDSVAGSGQLLPWE